MEGDHTLPAGAVAASGGRIEVGAQAGGRYKILRFIAAGAMGEVYAAEDLIIGTTIALKVLRAELQSSATALARLRREIALARQVTDVHVCRVHDVGEHGGRVFLTMELLEGKTLADHAAGAPLEIAEVERIARQLIAGLAALHRAGIVHRDFKAANTMVVGDRVVITDFGLARSLFADSDAGLTGEAAVLGTPAYMAPEQVEGKPATAASDIYALGIVLFELLTGRRPFAGESAMAIANARLSQDPPHPSTIRPGVPARWDTIVSRCLARDPADRFARVEDVLGEAAAQVRRSRTPLVAGGFGALAIAGVATYVLTRGPTPTMVVDVPAKPEVPALRERQLTSFEGRAFVSTVALSRDGKRIAYQAGGLWVRELDRAEPTLIDVPADRVAGMRVVDWFPDGQRLLVRTEEPDGYAIQIFDLRDRSFHMVRPGPRYAWLSPAADRIAYFSPNGVMTAPLAGTEKLAYASADGYQLAWSPSGKWLAGLLFGNRKVELVVMAADGSSSATLFDVRTQAAGVAWSGNDRLLFSRSSDENTNELCSVELVAGVWDRKAPTCVWKFSDAEVDWFGFAGGRLVFVKNAGQQEIVETVPIDAAGKPVGSRTPLPNLEGHAIPWGVLPDGRVLVTSSRGGIRSRIVAQRPSEPIARALTTADHHIDFPVADGDAIVFTRSSRQRCELVRRRGEQETTLLAEDRHEHAPCPYLRCSTNGRCVLVRLVQKTYEFRRFDLATAREVGPSRRRTGTGNTMVDVSLDGSTLVWAIEDHVMATAPALALLELDSGAYREIRPKGTLRPHDVTWFDADSWLVTGRDPDRTKQVIARMRSDGTYEHLVVETRPLDFHNPIRSPDGTFVAHGTGYLRTDIFALEGFR